MALTGKTNASQFAIGEDAVKGLLQSKLVVNIYIYIYIYIQYTRVFALLKVLLQLKKATYFARESLPGTRSYVVVAT